MALWGGLASGGATGANKALQLRRQQQQFQQQSDYRNQVLDESMRSNRTGERLRALQIQSQLLGNMGRSSGSGTGTGGGSVRDPDQLKRYLENVPSIAERSFYPSLGIRKAFGADRLWPDKSLSTAQVEGSVRDLGNQVFSYLQQRGFTPDTAQFNQAMQDTKSRIFLPPKESGGYDRKYLNRLQSVRQPGVSEGEWDKRLSDIYFGRDKTPNAEWVKGFMGEVDSALQGIPDGTDRQTRQKARVGYDRNLLDKYDRMRKEKGVVGQLFDGDFWKTSGKHLWNTITDLPSDAMDTISEMPGGKFLAGHGPPPGTPPPPIKTTPQPHPSQQDFRQRRSDEMQMFQQQLQGKGRAELFSMINTFPRGSQERDMILYMINAQLLNEAAGVLGQ